MNISAPFIRRPVATVLVMIAIVAFGVLAYVRLPVSALPNVDFPTILVSASLPGASAETMAASVATPLEREFSTIDGVTSMNSTSSLGSTNVTLQFDLGRDLDSAAQDVQAAISRAGTRLPPNMPSPPSYRKVNPADQPILYLALSSKTLPLYVVDEFAQQRLAQRISTVRGVAQVQVYGSQKYAVRVQMDPERLAARGIGLDDVAAAIQSANVNLPTGTLYSASKAYAIETNGQLENAAAYQSVIVSYVDGSAVRICDLGRAIDSVETDKTAAWSGDADTLQRAVVLAIQKQPGANTVEVAEQIRTLLPQFRQEIPASLDLSVLFDRSRSIEASVHDVQLTLLLTLALVVMVIFLFLRRFTATIIPSLAIPLAIVATFAVMYLCGYTLDNLSLMALTLSVGFVVDDAIVMLENIVRHTEQGKPPLQAAFEASSEIGFTILSMTISLVAVFLPFLFMGGIIGGLFREFAVTMAVAILVSGFISLSLTPMMTGRLLRTEHHQGRLYRAVERGFDAMSRFYGRTLSGVLARPVWVLVFSGLVLAGTVLLFRAIPQGFLPVEDNDQIVAQTEAVEGISFEAAKQRQLELTEIVRRDPDVAGFMTSVGARGSSGSLNQGIVFIRLKPRSERESSAAEVAARLGPKLNQVPGMRAYPQVPPTIRVGGTLTKSEYQLTLQGADTEQLYRHAPRLADELGRSPVLRDVTTDLQLENPELDVRIDRELASSLGVSAQRVEEALYSAYGSRQVSSIYSANNTYAVILELDPRTQTEPASLDSLYVRSSPAATPGGTVPPSTATTASTGSTATTASTGSASSTASASSAPGTLVPLRAVADVRLGVGPLTVNHAGQLPAVTVSFNVAPGRGLSDAVAVAQSTADRLLPPTITTRFQGSAQAFQSSLAGLGSLLLVTVFVIYIVLGILYESYVHPLTILSALPFAGFGALLTLWIFDVDLDVYAFVGIILLIGLVKKNGIMMVDFAVEAQKDPKLSARDAIHGASLARFRPIMMTTMAALLGTLPIALGFGAGAESRQPLGLAVVGGLLFSQLLTLYVTPVFYVYADHLQARVRRRRSRRQSKQSLVPPGHPAPAE